MTSGVNGIEGKEASLARKLLAVVDRIVTILNPPPLPGDPVAIIGSMGVAMPNITPEEELSNSWG
jgi:hypothetical protein